MTRQLLKTLGLTVLLCISLLDFAQAQDNLLTLTPRLKQGKLDNGVTYYFIQNKRPEKKVELRLVINAGSICEDDDQQGLAHMVEHMAFNGTKNFKKNDIVSYLQEIGVGFGSDLNAYTSFDETVYMLPIPIDKPGNLEKGFQILEDWAHQVTFLEDDIDSERGIILEESRLGKGAGERMFKQLLPGLLKNSLYAKRLPIGKDSIIKNFPHETIRRFYKDWYRPDLMAVVVVGDVPEETAMNLIRKHFSKIPKQSNARPRPVITIPPYDMEEVKVVSDKEITSYDVSVNWPTYPNKPEITEKDYRQSLVKSLYVRMLNQRLQELTRQSDPPFTYSGAGFGGIARNTESFSLSTSSGTSDPMRALQASLLEVERVKKFGFTQPELERTKKDLLAGYERSYNDREKAESNALVDECVRHFLEAEPMPGIEKEFAMVSQMLPGISLQEVNAISDRFKGDPKTFSYLIAPGSTKTALPAAEDVAAVIAKAEKAEVKPYEEKAIATSLLSSVPVAGKVMEKKQDVLAGATELLLSNGVRVLLKPTDFKNDQVLMNASRHGGFSNYGLEDKYNTAFLTGVMNSMGVGTFSPTDLRKAMAGKSVSVSPMITPTTDGFRGSSTVKDIETMFQLLYIYVTEPRKDTALFKGFMQRNKSNVAMMKSNPQSAFIDTTIRVLYNNDPRRQITIPEPEDFDKVNLDRSMQIYRERVGEVSGMQFVIVGNFKVEEITPLLEKYVASLPATGKKTLYKDNGLRPISGKKELKYYKGEDDKSLILAFYGGEIPYSEQLELHTEAMCEILNIRIIEELREKIQGIYGGGIYGNITKAPYQNYQLVAQLPCGPEKVDTLLTALNNEINELKKNGPSQKNLDKVKQQWKEQHRESLKQNEIWLSELMAYKVDGHDLRRFSPDYEKIVDQLSIQDIQKTAQLLFNGKNEFISVQYPAKK